LVSAALLLYLALLTSSAAADYSAVADWAPVKAAGKFAAVRLVIVNSVSALAWLEVARSAAGQAVRFAAQDFPAVCFAAALTGRADYFVEVQWAVAFAARSAVAAYSAAGRVAAEHSAAACSVVAAGFAVVASSAPGDSRCCLGKAADSHYQSCLLTNLFHWILAGRQTQAE